MNPRIFQGGSLVIEPVIWSKTTHDSENEVGIVYHNHKQEYGKCHVEPWTFAEILEGNGNEKYNQKCEISCVQKYLISIVHMEKVVEGDAA